MGGAKGRSPQTPHRSDVVAYRTHARFTIERSGHAERVSMGARRACGLSSGTRGRACKSLI
jgi:hypothetical protein